MILVAWDIDRRDLSLPEGVIERVVDLADRNPQPRRRIAIDDQIGFKGLVLLIAADIGKNRQRLKCCGELWCPFVQLVECRAYQRVLICGIARTPSGAEIADRLHE